MMGVAFFLSDRLERPEEGGVGVEGVDAPDDPALAGADIM